MKLSFPQLDLHKKKVQGQLNFFVASVYHPVDDTEHKNFIDILRSIMSLMRNTEEFIGGHEANANLGICTNIYCKTSGPWGIDN